MTTRASSSFVLQITQGLKLKTSESLKGIFRSPVSVSQPDWRTRTEVQPLFLSRVLELLMGDSRALFTHKSNLDTCNY